MATTVNIHEAKTNLSKLILRVEAGEEIVIARAGKPAVRLTALVDGRKKKRKLGGLAHLGLKVAKDIKGPFQEEMEQLFYGNPEKLNVGKKK